MLSIKNLKKSFDKREVLKGINLEINEGDRVGIIGPSGCGKSTLLRCLNLLEVPDSGEIIFNDNKLDLEDDLVEVRKNIGMVFQSFNLLPRLTALENVELPLVYSSIPKEERHKRANELLEMVGLKDRTHHRPNELSGGQRQRVAIARALVNNPSIILADEPTGNLDSKSEGEIIEILQKLNKMGKTIVIVTHEPNIGEIAERKIIFKDGEII